MSIEKKLFGTTKDGKDVYSYTIRNKHGMGAVILTYGGTLQALYVKDKHGKTRDVLVGFDDLQGFEERCDYQGVLVGRYANRIAGGKFYINGEEVSVSQNEKCITCLHGGGEFSSAVWTAKVVAENSVEVSYVSPDGAEGFPGEMTTAVTYTLTDDNTLVIAYKAVCTKDSFINLTNHAYFNLGGYDSGTVLNTELCIKASHYTPTDINSIPTGEIRPVEGTAFDFRTPKAIGKDIGERDQQLIMCGGYDHNFCLDASEGEPAVEAYNPVSGIRMKMYTTLPGVQLYTGNFLNGTMGKGDLPMYKNAGFCLETQFYPDTPNQPNFPQCLYKAGEVYTSKTIFQF